MRVHLGADHAAFDVKSEVVDALRAAGHEVVDHGPFAYDESDDYPPFCLRAAEGVAKDPDSLGVVLGGSGNGELIAANKVRGVRAALAWNHETARLARQHNNANVVSVGARQHDVAEAIDLIEVFLTTPYSQEERHDRRIGMITRFEETGELPPLPGAVQ